jgi:hypothetical protein
VGTATLLSTTLVVCACAATAPDRHLVAMRALQEQLAAHGRGEARVTLVSDGRTHAGTLAIEPPRFARLDLAGGETLTLHGDGGEWVQPRHRQVVHGGPESAAAALTWWAALVDPAGFRERAVSARVWDVTPPDSLGAGHARVWLDARGLPARLRITSGSGDVSEARLSQWRFRAPRGRAAFVARTPAGYEDVSVP